MNMKLKVMLLGLSIMTALPVCAQKPVYLIQTSQSKSE